MAVDKDIKKIDRRNWEKVKGIWLSSIPHFNYPGAAPDHEIRDIIDLPNLYSKTKQNQNAYFYDIPNLRSEILREGIYFSHKATHVCGTSIVHLNNGILSWAISSAYQASFFSVKAILNLLGLTFLRVNYKSLMIDCFPQEEQLSKNKIKQGFIPKQEMKFCIFDDLTHMQYWEVFQRILRIAELPLLDERIKRFLLQITPEQFVAQRNNLHYVSNYWLRKEDLFKRIFDNNFGVRENLIELLDKEIRNEQSDFSVFVCYLLLKLNIELIKSLSELSEEIKNEYDLIIKTLNEGIHDRLHHSISLD